MYNHHDTDQVNVYANHSAEAQSFEQTSSQSGQGSSDKTYTDDNTKKGYNSQETDHRSGPGHKNREGGRNNATNTSPATIEHYLKGMHYPADKKALVQQAQSNSAPEDVTHILDQFDDKEYSGVIEVNKEIGRVESQNTSNTSQQRSHQNERGASQKDQPHNDTRKEQDSQSQQNAEARSNAGSSSRQERKGESANVSPATIEHYLKGMHYPADKKALVQQAQSNSAPEDVTHILDQFDDKEYSGVIEVNKEIGRIASRKT